jgi:hypothetical protein
MIIDQSRATPSLSIDLNADLGESFGVYRYGGDEELLPLVSPANVACGFHGGDPSVMRCTVALAHAHGVAIGAHAGFPDLHGFGRRRLQATASQVKPDLCAALHQLKLHEPASHAGYAARDRVIPQARLVAAGSGLGRHFRATPPPAAGRGGVRRATFSSGQNNWPCCRNPRSGSIVMTDSCRRHANLENAAKKTVSHFECG